MRNKYLLYIGIFLCMGIWACSNDAVYYDVNQKRSIYFTWDRYNSVTKTASDTVFFSFALYNETEYEYRVPIKVAGMPLGEELTYEVEVVADSSTAKYDKHFKSRKMRLKGICLLFWIVRRILWIIRSYSISSLRRMIISNRLLIITIVCRSWMVLCPNRNGGLPISWGCMPGTMIAFTGRC